MTGSGQLVVKVIDDRSKRTGEQQRQFPATFGRHPLIVTGLADLDNRVYDLVNQVVELRNHLMSHVVKQTDTRTTVTPNATMTTLASPTLGSTAGQSLWLVEMSTGATGPLHVFDSEQIWTVLDGSVSIQIDGVHHALAPGDTAVIPATAERQVHADNASRLLVTGEGTAAVTVAGESESRGTPAWIS